MHEIIDNLDLSSKGLWFPVTVSIVLVLSVLIIPKKISWRDIYITFGVVGFATWLSDGILARAFDLFDIGNPKKAGLGDILSYTLIPTSLSILFLNFLHSKNKWMLTSWFTLAAFLIQFGMVQLGYMTFKGWNGYISIIVYVFAFGFLLPWHLKFITNE
ncbi:MULTISPECIES: hypothetical protein [Bacillaceae]|uniref:hypothetical protein n=1 Tax=Bacillaceae TaxID=186817 RepID=UPI001E545476|nr:MULTISPECIES: hypothetical protein [Bacillaceae]MCE4051479.1 hypothetical protein [Bacillus sp. Au-Bac7]MCM3031742.1 hypothetical protein [Niallia sp. MER 6]UPO89746.1 hypothetical protein L8T27_023360 [Niallia sp. Man26]